MNRTLFNQLLEDTVDENGTVKRIVSQEMYFEQLEYLLKDTKRIRESRWPGTDKLKLVGIYRPSMSYESHSITLVKIYKDKNDKYYIELHKTDKHHIPVIRYRRILIDIVPTI